MPLPLDSGYHILLNGKGFVLLDESYQKGSQKPFNPRFSTGDPSTGDLSFWQFLSQESWIGGSGQDLFTDKTKYRKAPGWDIRNGFPKLAFSPTSVSFDATAPAPSQDFGNQAAHFIYWLGDIYLIYNGTGAAGTRTTIVNAAAASNLPKIVHMDAYSAVPFFRGTDGILSGDTHEPYLGTVQGNNVVVYDDAFNSVYSLDLTAGGGGTITSGVYIPVDSQRAIVVAVDASRATCHRIKWDSGAWSGAASDLFATVLDVFSGNTFNDLYVPSSYAIDADGVIYFALSSFDTNTPRGGSRLYRITAADATATNFMVTQVSIMDEFQIVGFHQYAGVIYMLGVQYDESGGRVQIRKLNGTVLWESTKVEDINNSGGEKFTIIPHHSSIGKLTFMCRTDADTYNPIYVMDEKERVREVAAFDWTPTQVYERTGILFFSGSYFFFNHPGTASLLRTLFIRGRLPITGNPAWPAEFEFSEMGGNTPLIEKSLYSVKVELSSALDSDFPMTVLVNDIEIGKVKKSDGKKAELVTTQEIVGSSFIVKLRIGNQSTWGGYLKRVTLRYIPTQFKKLQWGMSFRLDLSQKLLNGQRESRSPLDMANDLQDAWKSNKPVKFRDIDGKDYNVIVTDFKFRSPLIADKKLDREAVAIVELLEV